MDDISNLETRFAAALERISKAVGELESRSASTAADATSSAQTIASEHLVEIEALQAALAAERESNQELEARVTELQARQEQQVAELESEVAELRNGYASHNTEMRRLRGVISELRTHNAGLRQANAKNVGDAETINAALQTELDAVAVTRDAETVELDAIISELTKLARSAAREEA